MNCLDFHRQTLIDPHHVSDPARAHSAECAACRSFLNKLLERDALTAEALRARGREGLEQRLLLAYRLRGRRRFIGLALAASLLLISAVSGWLIWRDSQLANAQTWIARMGERLEWDPLHLKAPADDAPQRLVEAVRELGGRIDSVQLEVIQARICKLDDHWVVHLVMDVGGERVVAFIVPRALPEGASTFGAWQARLSSRDGGSIGVFAQKRATAEKVLYALQGRLHWSA